MHPFCEFFMKLFAGSTGATGILGGMYLIHFIASNKLEGSMWPLLSVLLFFCLSCIVTSWYTFGKVDSAINFCERTNFDRLLRKRFEESLANENKGGRSNE